MGDKIAEKYDYKNMDNYIKNPDPEDSECSKYSVCREERQYALFLYNILRKYHSEKGRKEKDSVSKIFQVCQIPDCAEIKNVFYEAAFMRDFFKRDKRCAYVSEKTLKDKLLNIDCSEEKHKCPYGKDKDTYKERFNYRLLEYLLGENRNVLDEIVEYENNKDDKNKVADSILDLNLGGKAGRAYMDKIIRELDIDDEIKKEMEKAQILMNVKPDIAVIFERKEKLYLKFLECKFESSEDTYDIPEYDIHITQTKAQDMVGDFLCNYLKIKDEDQFITTCETRLVYFRRNSKVSEPDKIRIDELIKLNNDIFS